MHAMDMNYSYYVNTCTTSIPSISNTLKKLSMQSDLHSYHIKTIYNYKEEIINKTFSTNVESLLYDLNNPALIQ